MLAAITKWLNKDLIGIHRIYLGPACKGKALIEPNKMMLGKVNSEAVRLSPISNNFMIAEGQTRIDVRLVGEDVWLT